MRTSSKILASSNFMRVAQRIAQEFVLLKIFVLDCED